MSSRIFVTGMGVATSLGIGVETFFERLVAGCSGIRKLTRFITDDLPCRIGGEIPDEELDRHSLPPVHARRLDRATRLALVAASEAVAHAQLSAALPLGDRAGVIIGSGLSGLDTLEEETERLLTQGAQKVSPFTIPTLMPNATPANIALAFGATGPSYSVSSACASSGHALIDAADWIRRGICDLVITGGTESSLFRLALAAFARMRALPTEYNSAPERASRPFDRHRAGLVMSEGAGIVVLESEAHCRRRGVTPHAELIGHGVTTDAYHIVQPAPHAEQCARAIRQALDSAGLSPGEVASRAYINAHGTGTRLNDALESLAIRQVFGRHADHLQISSTKSMTGHLIGAAGAVETVACVTALQRSCLPPTVNLDTPDPECDLDYVPLQARSAEVHYALNHTFGFGGHNVVLLFQRLHE